MSQQAIIAAASHLRRNLALGDGHGVTPDPQPQAVGGGEMVVRFSRDYRGIPLFLQSISVRLNADNDVTRTGGSLGDAVWHCAITPDISAEQAVQLAAEHFRSRQAGGDPCRVAHRALLARGTLATTPLASFPLASRPAVFRTRRGAAAAQLVIVAQGNAPQLCWLVRLPTGANGEYLNAVAAAGEVACKVIFCAPWTAGARCSASVFRSAPDPAGANRESVVFPMPLAAYPPNLSTRPGAALFADWMDDASMIGNCVEMFLSNAPKTLKALQTPGGLQLAAVNDPFGLDQALVNAFYLCNYLHDFFLLLGFGEAEGNFQLVNRPGIGRGKDRLRVRVFDSVIDRLGIMQARDDGITPELRLGRSPGKQRLAALDPDIVIHEYSHGVSHRIVGGRLGFNSLLEEQSIAIDEGWSDYFALTIQNASRANAQVSTFGAWVSGNPAGIRLARYDSNHPATYATLGSKPYDTPIAAAEVWAYALMRMNELIGHALVSNMRGHEIGWSVVVRSMKLLDDDNPTFVQARQAVLDAFEPLRKDGVITAAERDQAAAAARQAFRERGLGANASSNGKKLGNARADFS